MTDKDDNIEVFYSNPETTLRLQTAFAAGVEYVMTKQEVTAVDILAALRGSFMTLATSEIIDKSLQSGKMINAQLNQAAFLGVLSQMHEEIAGWLEHIPSLENVGELSCGGTGFIAVPASSPGPPEGECCPGCPQCAPVPEGGVDPLNQFPSEGTDRG